MLKGSTVVDLLNAIVPLYVCIALGFVSSKFAILPHLQTYGGIGGFASKFGIPILIFRMVATNNPYLINIRLIGADTIFKIVVLIGLSINCFIRPSHHYLAWVSTIFNLMTIPNVVLIGAPLLTALYPGTAQNVTSLIFMQSLVWFSVCVLLLEIHKAVYENSKDFKKKELRDLESTIKLPSKSVEGTNTGHTKSCINYSGTLDEEGISLPVIEPQQGESLLKPGVGLGAPEADCPVINIPQDAAIGARIEGEGPQTNGTKDCVVKVLEHVLEEEAKPNKCQVAKRIAKTVLERFIWSPLVWGCILGFVYAILNFRYNHDPYNKPFPTSLATSINLMANGVIGICMFMLGQNMGVAPKLFACGIPKTLLGVGLRFVVTPACMAVISLAVGLRGQLFAFAVVQATVPQGILSFFFHSQYNIHVEIFSTAVWFQTLVFFPIAIALDLLLNVMTGSTQALAPSPS